MAGKISEMTTASQVNDTDNIELSQGSSGSGFASVKATILSIAQRIVSGINFTSDLQTTNKTITGAINEVAHGGVDVVAEDFDASKTYAVGDYVIYGGSLYKCTTAVTVAGNWNSNDWTETLVMDEVEQGGGGGGTTVIANPTGTPTDELETIQIGNDIYEVVGGGGGSAEWIDVVGTLEAGETEIVLTSSKIKTTSVVFPWTDKFGIAPTNMVVANGSVTLTFPVQSTDLGVMVRVSKVNTGHTYDIDLSHLQIDKSWFYYDANKTIVTDTGDGLQIAGNDDDNSWTTSGLVCINVSNMIGIVPSTLSAIRLHFSTFGMSGYTGIRFMNTDTLFSGTTSGTDTNLRTQGFYQFENNNSSIEEEDYTLEIPCTASNFTNTYFYIMFFDGMVAGNTSGYNNGLNGTYNIVIDGIDFVTGGN